LKRLELGIIALWFQTLLGENDEDAVTTSRTTISLMERKKEGRRRRRRRKKGSTCFIGRRAETAATD
jgi:hypothetical protein